MKDLDAKIRAALEAEDDPLLDEIDGEPPLHEMILETFRGRWRWIVAMSIVVTLGFLGVSIFAAIRFFEADTVREMLMWGAGFAFAMMAIFAMKIWYWMELNKNAVTREVKRVELQLARLAARLREAQSL